MNEQPRPHETILLVEDEDTILTMVTRVLIQGGYRVIQARNGKDALRNYDPKIINLVVTDLLMPDMDGIELIRSLRNLDSAVKIIAMSGGCATASTAFLSVAKDLGAISSLEKPFSKEALLNAVHAAYNPAK